MGKIDLAEQSVIYYNDFILQAFYVLVEHS